MYREFTVCVITPQPWVSYQIHKIAGCACTGKAGNVFPATDPKRKPLDSDPGMHHGTCVTHVPWCMLGSLSRVRSENVPGIPGACATRNFTYLVRHPSLTLSQCTLAGPVYTGMPLECQWLTQCTLEYHWATQRIHAGYTGTPLEKLSGNSPTLECHWRNLVESAPHWDATGDILTFAAYTGTPLEGLWQPPHAPTHIYI